MKKLTTALLTALLLLNLAACGEKEPDDTSSGYDDSLISELYSEEGEYTDAENNTLAYSYHVPRIVSETAVAAALNDEIADQFGALVQEQKNMMASRVSLTCLSVTWTSYWNDSLLCLVVRAEMDGDTSMTELVALLYFQQLLELFPLVLFVLVLMIELLYLIDFLLMLLVLGFVE